MHLCHFCIVGEAVNTDCIVPSASGEKVEQFVLIP